MSLSRKIADEISSYLCTGMHHSTEEAKDEIARIISQKINISSQFDETQRPMLDEWLSNHRYKCIYPNKSGAIGGALTYSFTPTSLGVIKKVICACGAELDLTDYDAF